MISFGKKWGVLVGGVLVVGAILPVTKTSTAISITMHQFDNHLNDTHCSLFG
jgi:hypothetical protein